MFFRNRGGAKVSPLPINEELDRLEKRLDAIKPVVVDLYKKTSALKAANEARVNLERSLAAGLTRCGEVLDDLTMDLDSKALSQTLMELSGFQESAALQTEKRNVALNAGLAEPLAEFVHDLNDAKKKKKAFDRLKTNYHNSRIRTRQLKDAKKVNHDKVEEAKKERNALKARYLSAEKDIAALLKEVFLKHQMNFLECILSSYVRNVDLTLGASKESLETLQGKIAEIKQKDRETMQVKLAVHAEKEAAKLSPDVLRMQTFEAMVACERKFVHKMDSVAAFRNDLLDDPQLKDKVDLKRMELIFGNFDEIWKAHVECHVELENILKNHGEDLKGLGTHLKRMANVMQTSYPSYVRGLSTALDGLKKAKLNRSFRSALRIDLSRLLPLPLTHAKEFVNLSQSLKEHLDADTPAHADTLAGVEALVGALDEVKECEGHSERLGRVWKAVNRITGLEDSFVVSHARVVMIDELEMIEPPEELDQMPKRVFVGAFLFNVGFIFGVLSSRFGKLPSYNMLGSMDLAQAKLFDREDTEELVNSFELHLDSLDEEEPKLYCLVCSSAEKKAEWMENIHQMIALRRNSQVFGVPLARLVHRHPLQEDRAGGVAWIADQCISWLTAHALHHDGLFRVSGSVARMNAMKHTLDLGGPLALHNEDPNNVAGLLKAWLRDLPEPLLTYAAYEECSRLGAALLEAEAEESSGDGTSSPSGLSPQAMGVADSIRSIVSSLPKANSATLSRVMGFLCTLSLPANVQHNRMDAANLAIVFAPTLLSPKRRTADMGLSGQQKAQFAFVRFCIAWADRLFNSDVPREHVDLESAEDLADGPLPSKADGG